MPKSKIQKPLTLDELVVYNQEVLLPAMEERFATKREFGELKADMGGLKKEFGNFKNESLINQDTMLKKLEIF